MKILVLCSANMGRSPILSSLLKYNTLNADHLIVSAGTNVSNWKLVGHRANKESIDSVSELTNSDFDITNHQATQIDVYDVNAFDCIITLSDRSNRRIRNDMCVNIYKYLHMHFETVDPFDFESMLVVRNKHEECVRQLKNHVLKIISELNL